LETGVIDPHATTQCNGGGTYYDTYFPCHATHGAVDLHRGIVASCDVYFYTAGAKIGIDNIAKYAQIAGLGEKTGVDLPGEKPGLMPSTRWKLQAQRDKWYPGETISVAIGQGAVEVTPLQLASAIGGMAIGGTWYKPHLVKETAPREAVRKADWNGENISTVVSGMYGVVNEAGGTGASARLAGISVAGKTGSAQRISNALAKSNKELAKSLADNGVFVGFAPAENPEIVVVTLIEAGIHGGLDAAPISASVIKAYFDKKTRSANNKPQNVAMLLWPKLVSFGRYRE
jgi:penicillin-binding protein 2